MSEACREISTNRAPRHLFGLVALTVGVSTMVSMPNGPTLSGTTPASVGRIVMLLVYPAVFATAVLSAWLFVRRPRRERATAPASTEASAVEPRSSCIPCFILGIVFLLLGVLSIVANAGRLSMVNWLIGRVPWERDAAIFMGLGLATWGIAFASLGVHYYTQRYRWLAHSSLLQAVLGWLILALAVWLQWSHMTGTE